MRPKISALIFDIGNVLLPFNYMRATQRLMDRNGLTHPPEEGRIIQIRHEYERGRIGRAEFLVLVKEAFQHTDSDESFVEIWCDIFEENTPLHAKIPTLAAAYPLYLLSNIGCIHHEFIQSRYPIFAHFTAGVYSYEAGVLKPNPRIYQIAQERFGVVPEETLFIDDLPENIEAARTAGFQGFVYDWQKHDLLEAELSA